MPAVPASPSARCWQPARERSVCRSNCWRAPAASTAVITSPHIQKTGLALAGFHEYLKPGRVLIFGESEIRYLESLDAAARATSLRLALTLDFPCVLITGGFTPPPELAVEAERARLPLLKTPVPTPTAIAKLSSILEDSLAERTMIHAVLMDILGLGVLIVGESGIGKSECALDLIVRGHRLVADDTVEVRRRAGDDPHRHLPRADAPPHGAARPRRHQHQGSVRHRVDAIVEARRARRPARTLGSDARVRAARPGRRRFTRFSGCACR